MPIFTLETYLVPGFSKKEIIDTLIGLDDKVVNRVLASSPHTNQAQLLRLYSKASVEVSVLIASRSDLSPEWVERIIKTAKPLTRQALFARWSTQQKDVLRITDERINSLLEQDWFTAEHAQSLLNCMPDESSLRSAVKQAAEDWILVTKKRAYKSSAARISDIRYKDPYKIVKSQFSEQIPITKRYIHKILALKKEDLLSCVHGHLSVFDYGDPVRIASSQLAPEIEKLLGEVNLTLYQLFFQILPSWQGSILELIDTAKSIAPTPAQNSEKTS